MKSPARQSKQNMRTELRKTKASPANKQPTPEGERRIHAAWLRLLRAILKGPSLKSKVQSQKSAVQGSKFDIQRSKFALRSPAAPSYLSRFLCVAFALALLGAGCANGPLKGGRAVITRKPAGIVEQTLVQSENPQEAARQDQESVRVRTYTVPAGSRVEQSQSWEGWEGERTREHKLTRTTEEIRAREDARPPGRPQPSTLNSQPSTAFTLSAPMPVVEREETRARTELGAAQKDTARELGAKLASLKGIVWVGAGLFVFGLASLVWPPLKAVIGSVTTSAACALGGIALMVLPSLVVGNELLILGVVVLAVGGWALAHRHGHAAAYAAIAKSQ
jgi:hypothetical protein